MTFDICYTRPLHWPGGNRNYPSLVLIMLHIHNVGVLYVFSLHMSSQPEFEGRGDACFLSMSWQFYNAIYALRSMCCNLVIT